MPCFVPIGSFCPRRAFVSLACATPAAVHPTDPPVAVGDYLTHIACRNCHRLDVEHQVKPGTIAPPLRAVAQGCDLTQFTHLMRTGKAIGERDVGLMSEVAKDSFTHFSDAEIAAMHAYLNAGEETAVAPAANAGME